MARIIQYATGMVFSLCASGLLFYRVKENHGFPNTVKKSKLVNTIL